MKLLLFFILFCICFATHAQLSVTSNTFDGNTTISTEYQTLHTDTLGNTTKVTDNVVGVRVVGHKKDTYWLFFYSYPYDIPAPAVNISTRRYAYLRTAQDKYYRIPYTGKSYTYSTSAKAGFFIDITKYVAQLNNEVITDIRFETSVLYHAIELKDTDQETIAHIVGALISH